MTSLSGLLPAGGLKEQLATVFTQIREAQTLDVNGDELGAYRHYLSSVCLTLQVLSGDIQANQGQGTLPEPKVQQLFKMAKDCMERGEDIFATARKEKRPLALFRLATPSPTVSPTLCTPPLPPNCSTSLRSSSNFRSSTLSSGPSQNSITSSQKMNAPSNNSKVAPPPGSSSCHGRIKSWPLSQISSCHPVGTTQGVDGVQGSLDSQRLPRVGFSQSGHFGRRAEGNQSKANVVHITSFMEEARLRNRHMMEQYKSHLRQQYSVGSGRPVSNEAGLSMLRRLEENLSVARIREQNIAKRLKEKRLKEKEVGSKAKPAVTFSSLSVDELCDHVTSFEHGKSRITALKAHLNASESDPSIVYSSISEILSIIDHPLSRLLGEYQYNVYMMLQSVGGAVEKAGGLPRLDIWLDPDTKPSGSGPLPPVSGRRDEEEESEDALLELLEEEEEESAGAAHWSDRYPVVEDSFDNKLKRLKRELTEEDTAEATWDKACSGSENSMSRNENTKQSGSTCNQYQNVSEASLDDELSYTLDDELSYTPMFDSGSNKQEAVYKNTGLSNSSSQHENDSRSNLLELHKNESYSLIPALETCLLAPDAVGSGGHSNGPARQNLYEDLDQVSQRLQERENIMDTEESDTHLYDTIDNVFENKGVVSEGSVASEMGVSGEQVGNYVETDGGVLSHQGVRSDVIEMEELVVFKNLPPLLCSAHLGEEVVLGKLADSAATVLKEVVKQVHHSLNVLQQCFSSCYPILSSEENQELCHSVLEASFFPAIISLLTIVYRCKNYKQEVAVAKNMYQQVNASPKDLAVRHKYWLLEQRYAPYGEAIDEVRRMTSFQYPSSKLECVVRMSKHVIKCIEDYCRQHRPEAKVDLVGVDDMLPILSFVILRSGMPQLISECSIMEEFIQEGYIMGEEGFCLTSFLTALRYIVHMSAESS